MPAYYDLPLNLPHAGRIALRLARLIESRALGEKGNLAYLRLGDTIDKLDGVLRPYQTEGDPPDSDPDAESATQEAARLGRELAREIGDLGLHDDRIGQCVRNLFECLGMGKEGAERGLQAGENPLSLQRPAN